MIVFDEAFDAQRLERSLVDFRKFTGRQLADYCAEHLPGCFTDTLRAAAGKIANGGSGSLVGIPRRSARKHSGSRSWTISTITRAAKDWSDALRTGVSHPPPTTCRTAESRVRCGSVRWSGNGSCCVRVGVVRGSPDPTRASCCARVSRPRTGLDRRSPGVGCGCGQRAPGEGDLTVGGFGGVGDPRRTRSCPLPTRCFRALSWGDADG